MAILKDTLIQGACRVIGDAYFNAIKSGAWNGTAIAVAYGGTGATTAAGARTNLGIGSVGTLSYGSDTTKYLRNDGTWQVPPNTTYKFTIGSTTKGDSTNGVDLGTLKSETAASGGTTLSLVTTGEKATWNAKTSNAGTVTKVIAGTGLSIGSTAQGNFTTSGTINHTNSVTAQTTQAVYPIKIDECGHISAYGTAVSFGTASSHAHGDYVTSLSWDSTNNCLSWSKGGTAQNGITIGFATQSTRSTYLTLNYSRGGSSPNNSGAWSTVKNGPSNTISNRVQFWTIYDDGGPTTYGDMLEILSSNANHWQPQLWFAGGAGSHMYYRNKDYNSSTWGSWLTVLDSGNYTSYVYSKSTSDGRYVYKAGDTMTGALTVPSISVTGAATFSQAINGSILGNAATASRLQNARTISLTGHVTGSGSFDGSGNLSISTSGPTYYAPTSGASDAYQVYGTTRVGSSFGYTWLDLSNVLKGTFLGSSFGSSTNTPLIVKANGPDGYTSSDYVSIKFETKTEDLGWIGISKTYGPYFYDTDYHSISLAGHTHTSADITGDLSINGYVIGSSGLGLGSNKYLRYDGDLKFDTIAEGSTTANPSYTVWHAGNFNPKLTYGTSPINSNNGNYITIPQNQGHDYWICSIASGLSTNSLTFSIATGNVYYGYMHYRLYVNNKTSDITINMPSSTNYYAPASSFVIPAGYAVEVCVYKGGDTVPWVINWSSPIKYY